MTEEANTLQEPENQQVTLLSKSEGEITPEDLEAFRKFAEAEAELYISAADRYSSEGDEIGSAAYTHTFAYISVQTRMQNNQGLQVVFAKRGQEIVGYSVAEIDKAANVVNNTFLGVANKYQNKGIGTLLLTTRHNALKSLGITSYTTNARESVLRLYDKLGINYTILPQDPNESRFNTTIGSKVKVSLPQ